MSGRSGRRRSGVVTCRSKSQRSTMPASSGDVLERGLAPRAAHLRLAQGGDQRRRLAAQRLAGVAHGADVGAQLGRHRDPLLLDLGQPGLELLEARGHRSEQLLGRLQPLLCRGVDRLALPLGDLVGEQPELVDHRLPVRLDLLRASQGRVALGERHGNVGLGPRGGDAGVGELLVQLGQLARVAPIDWRRPTSTPSPAPTARARRTSSAVVMQASSPRPPTEPRTTRPGALHRLPCRVWPSSSPAVPRPCSWPRAPPSCSPRRLRSPRSRTRPPTAWTRSSIASDAASRRRHRVLRRRRGERQRHLGASGAGVRRRDQRRGRRGGRGEHRGPRRLDTAGLPGAGAHLRRRGGLGRGLGHRQRGQRRRAAPTSSTTASTGLGDDWVEGAGSVSGGEGNDTLREISGSVQGGSGDDLIVGAPAGLIDGGSGFDSVVIDYSAFTSQTTRQPGDHRRGHQRLRPRPPASRRTTSRRPTGCRPTASTAAFYSGRVSFHSRAGDDTFLGGPGADVADLGSRQRRGRPRPGLRLRPRRRR